MEEWPWHLRRGEVAATFDVSAEAYTQFMGRYSQPLAQAFMGSLWLRPGERVLDVGCGAGALTAEIVAVVGSVGVAAVDPSPPFVASMSERFPEVDVREASAESLPFEDGSFDVCAAQLVVHFMSDPRQGLAEMARVTRHGGRVAANVWDCGGVGGPLHAFWRAARALDPAVTDESQLPGVRAGHLVELMREAGLNEVIGGSIDIEVRHETFQEWWEPFTAGVGPAGAYVRTLNELHAKALRERCRTDLGAGPVVVRAKAWTAQGVSGARLSA